MLTPFASHVARLVGYLSTLCHSYYEVGQILTFLDVRSPVGASWTPKLIAGYREIAITEPLAPFSQSQKDVYKSMVTAFRSMRLVQ